MTATCDCQGAVANSVSSWTCSQQTVTVTFADASTKTFSATAFDPNQLGSVGLNACDPASLESVLSAADGSKVTLSMSVPNDIFAAGTAPLRSYSAPYDDHSASVSIALSPPHLALSYPGGMVTGGTLTVKSATYDPNQRLAFTVDAQITAPAANEQDSAYALYCGEPGEYYNGQWLLLNVQP